MLGVNVKVVRCSYCNTLKEKHQTGKKNDRFIYVDETNKQWKGARCPDCWSKKLAENYKKRKDNQIDYTDI